MSTQTMTFTDEQLDELLSCFFGQYSHKPSAPCHEQAKSIFKPINDVNDNFYWGQYSEKFHDYYDEDEYLQWLIDSGECEDWEEAQDSIPDTDTDTILSWLFTDCPSSDENIAQEFDEMKEDFLEYAREDYDKEEEMTDSELLNFLIADVAVAQNILDSLTK